MTVRVLVEEAAAHLSDLVQKVLGGEEVVIKVGRDDQEQVKVELGDMPIGLCPINQPGIHDIDATKMVGDHKYPKKTGQILARCSQCY